MNQKEQNTQDTSTGSASKKRRQLALKLTVSTVLLFIIFKNIDKQQLIDNIKLVNWAYAPIIFLFLILNYVLGAVRWKALLIFKNSEKITTKYLVNLYFIGSFFNNFMPTSIGGDVYKFVKLGKKMGNTTDAFSSTFMERFTGVLMLAAVGIFGLTKEYGWWVIPLFVLFIIGFFVGVKVLGILSKKIKKLEGIYNSLIAYKDHPKKIGWALGTSVVVQFLAIFTQYFVFKSIGIDLPIFYSLFVIPIITLAGFVVPSINGIGVQDALYMQFFSAVGVPTEVSLSASILYHLSRLAISLIGGVLYALGKDE